MHEASHGDQISNGKSTFADSNLTTSALQNSLLKEKKRTLQNKPDEQMQKWESRKGSSSRKKRQRVHLSVGSRTVCRSGRWARAD
jgi:hypothetical protein